MREVNNNTANSANINFVQPKVPVDKQVPEVVEVQEEMVDTTDLRKMPAEVIGRSQVSKTALERDVEEFLKNPEMVEKSLRFYEMCEQMHMEPSEAAALMGAYAEEFML